MENTAKFALTALFVVAIEGCVPTTSSLVRARRYDDAMCHAMNATEAASVVAAVERDLDVRFHLYAVHRDELQPVLGDKADEVNEKVTFVRSKVGTNKLPSRFSSSLSLTTDEKSVFLGNSSTPSDTTAALLFSLTGERLPTSTTAIDEAKLTKEIGWAVFTLGLKQLLFGADKVTYTRAPEHADFVAKGPRAMSIYDGLRTNGDDIAAFLIPKSIERSTKIKIALNAMTFHEDGGTCSISLTYEAPVGLASRPLGEVIDDKFRAGVLRPSDVQAVRHYALSNPIGSWSSK